MNSLLPLSPSFCSLNSPSPPNHLPTINERAPSFLTSAPNKSATFFLFDERKRERRRDALTSGAFLSTFLPLIAEEKEEYVSIGEICLLNLVKEMKAYLQANRRYAFEKNARNEGPSSFPLLIVDLFGSLLYLFERAEKCRGIRYERRKTSTKGS